MYLSGLPKMADTFMIMCLIQN